MRAYRTSARPLRPGVRTLVCPACAGLGRVRVYTGPLGGPPLMGDVLCERERACGRCGGVGTFELDTRAKAFGAGMLDLVVRAYAAVVEHLFGRKKAGP